MVQKRQKICRDTAGWSWRLLAAIAALALTAAGSEPCRAGIVGSAHDFVDNGFTGGGVCASCHIPHDAGDDRLWARTGDSETYPTAPRRLCMDCHKDPASNLATIFSGDSAWSAVTSVMPAALPSGHLANPDQYLSCSTCHPHASIEGREPFVPDTKDCLTCHRAGAFSMTEPGGGWVDDADDMEVDKFFAGVGVAPPYTIRSEHNIRYNAGGDLSTTADNECRKCHGRAGVPVGYNGHPNDTIFLVDPDGNAYADARATTSDFSAYEAFCLSCHDGQVNGGQAAVEQQFANPVIPADQVAATDPSDPSKLQTAAPWEVPAVPPTTAAPYFANYSDNGHGATDSLIMSPANTMDVTCLAGGAGDGCHTAHGSRNRFLIGSFAGPDADTNSEFGTMVCGGCHFRGVNFALSTADPGVTVSTFHGWWGNGTVLHDDDRDGSADGMAQWAVMNGTNMDISVSPTSLGGTMPFYGDPTGGNNEIHQRAFPTGGLTTSNWMHCLSCHDPHGTWDDSQPTPPDPQPGMLRRMPVTWEYDDPLCGQCHVE